MFKLDENRPDYFTDDTADTRPDQPARAGATLDFGTGNISSVPAPASKPRRRRGLRFLIWTIIICLLAIVGIGYFRYFSPYITDSRITGYVANVEKRGLIFKTYEADVITDSNLADTSRVYSRSLTVTIPSPEVARRLQQIQGSGQRVTLVTERYYGMLPWRGGSTTVVTAIAP